MSASQYRNQLDRIRRNKAQAEKKAAEYKSKEASKRAAASKARAASSKSSNATTVKNKLKEAERREGEATDAGKSAASWQSKAAGYLQDEASVQKKIARAERGESDMAERSRKREQQQINREAAAERALVDQRLTQAEKEVAQLREMPSPKAENLRVLMLGASSEGELRVGREQQRIQKAVRYARHRDLIEIKAYPAATTDDLLDGITGFRPHVVHFSGHSNADLVVFEDDKDERHEGVVVRAEAFARAVKATDDPPLLILLNSCHSASQIDRLVDGVAPFAIGMSDAINDGDAITYAGQFYAAITNGQSINAAHLSAQAALELNGLEGADLPVLAHAADVDPATTVLVKPATN